MHFAHLHAHSYFSLGLGTASPEALARAAAERGMQAAALTDTHSLGGAARFMRACREAGIRPALGLTLTVGDARGHWQEGGGGRLTLLARTEAGWRNLIRLLNASWRGRRRGEGPQAAFADLATCSEGLFILEGGSGSVLRRLAEARQVDAALDHLKALCHAADRESVFIEIHPPGSPQDEKINRRLLDLADYLGLGAAATQDIWYIAKSDRPGAFAAAAGERADQEDWRKWQEGAPPRHFSSAEEMRAQFGWRPDLLECAWEIHARCRFEKPSGAQHFPVHALPGGDIEAILWERAVEGLKGRGDESTEERLMARLDREFGRLREAGLAPYALLLSDLAACLDRAGVFRGPARGVWQASALAYALGLSRLNPVVFHLPEPEWKGGAGAPPPFRMEIAEEDLESAREAFERFLGDNHVGRVGRWPARGRKALLRDLGRRFGVSEAKLKRLLAEEPRTARQRRKAEKAKEGNGNGHGNGHGAAGEARIDDAAFLRAAAETLDGAPSGLRPDGCSFVFSGQDIEESVPFEPLRDAGPVSQFDAEALDYFGLPWMELTPRPAASVIKAALRHIWEHEAPKFRIEEAPLDDAEAFAALGMGRIGGLPELNSISTRALLRAAPPSSLIELAEMFRHSSAGAEAETGEGKPDLSASLPSALLAYWAAYLKARHGAAFMAASLTRAASSPKPLAILLRETRRLGLDILPPHINFSRFEFSPEHKGIRTGLSVVRQFGPIAYAELDRERQGRPFDDLVDLCRRTDSRILNHRTIGNLVKAGALDCFGSPRSHLLAALDAIFRDVRMEREKEEEIAGQPTLFDMNELERKIPGEDAQLDEMPEFSLEKRLRLEREAAGYFVSVDPFDFYRELTKQLKARPAADIRKSDIGRNAFIVGYIDAQETEGPLISESTVAALDCEGTIVRVARGARSCIGPSLACEGPVLMGAIGRRREKDLYWEVWTIHSMDDVWRLARQVERIILDPAGLDERRAREIADLLKSYRGTTKVVLDRTRGEAPRAGKIDGASTLFCPPVHLGLLAHLPASQIRILDGEGHAPKLPEAAILE